MKRTHIHTRGIDAADTFAIKAHNETSHVHGDALVNVIHHRLHEKHSVVLMYPQTRP